MTNKTFDKTKWSFYKEEADSNFFILIMIII